MALRFENLKGKDTLDVIQALTANAKVLFATADDAALKKNYGVARSLLVLGAEECVKGGLLFLRSIGIKVFTFNEARKALNSHKERHEIAMIVKLFRLL